MHQLVEGVLSIGARLTEIDGARRNLVEANGSVHGRESRAVVG